MSTYARYSSTGSGGGGGGGGGDVTGPASSVAGELALYLDTTGKVLTNSSFYENAGSLAPRTDANLSLGNGDERYNQLFLAAGLSIGPADSLNLFWDTDHALFYADLLGFKGATGGNDAEVQINTLSITHNVDRDVINADGSSGILEIHTAGNLRMYIADDKPQVSIIAADCFFEQMGGVYGSMGWLEINVNDIGWVEGQQDVNPGFTTPRHIALNGTIFFVAASDAPSTNLSSNLLQLSFNGGTIAGVNRQLNLKNADSFIMGNAGGANYMEIYMGQSGLTLIQTNLDIRMNSVGTVGRLIIADQNAAANGKRLQEVTLVGGTVIKSNNSVTANTVLIPINNGLAGATVPPSYSIAKSAGVGYTVTSSDPTDTSTITVFLIENGS